MLEHCSPDPFGGQPLTVAELSARVEMAVRSELSKFEAESVSRTKARWFSSKAEPRLEDFYLADDPPGHLGKSASFSRSTESDFEQLFDGFPALRSAYNGGLLRVTRTKDGFSFELRKAS